MSLEQALVENTKAYLENTAAVNALTAILKGQTPVGIKLTPTTAKKEVEPKTPSEAEIKQVKVDSAPPSPVNNEIPTLEEATKTLMALAKLDRNSAVEVLTSYQVKKASDVPETERHEFLQIVQERLKKAQGLQEK